MVMRDQTTCPKCGGELKYYDSVPRLVRTKGRETARVSMRRFRCVRCGAVHRELSELLVPYKQYEAEVKLEADCGELVDIGGKTSQFWCPVCRKERYIPWSSLRKRVVYEDKSAE